MRPVEDVNLNDMEIREVSTDAEVLVVRQEEDGSYRLFEDEKDRTPVLDESGGKVLDIHGKDYKLLPNSEFIEIVKGVTGDQFRGYVRQEDKRMDVYYFPERNQEIEPVDGDTIKLGLRFSNSYDGSSALRVQFIGERQVCSNGMTTEGLLDKASTRHSTHSLSPEDFAELVEERFKETNFDLLEEILRDAREQVITSPIEWFEAFSVIENLPSALTKYIQSKFVKEDIEQLNRYQLYNMCTRAITHGYVRTKSGELKGGADTYSESYLQRLHKKVNKILLIQEGEVQDTIERIREQEEFSEKAKELKAQVVAEP